MILSYQIIKSFAVPVSIAVALLIGSCNNSKDKIIESRDSSVHVNKDSPITDLVLPTDTSSNKDIAGKLAQVRENFKRINSITKWDSVRKKELGLTTEGGEGTLYYSGKGLEKVVVQLYGETFQQRMEYYLVDGKLSFAFGKAYRYNRPMYYDSTAMKENNDTEAFDMKKSTIIEERSYFDKGKLFHRVSSDEPGKSYDARLLQEEEQRILADFADLIKLDN